MFEEAEVEQNLTVFDLSLSIWALNREPSAKVWLYCLVFNRILASFVDKLPNKCRS